MLLSGELSARNSPTPLWGPHNSSVQLKLCTPQPKAACPWGSRKPRGLLTVGQSWHKRVASFCPGSLERCLPLRDRRVVRREQGSQVTPGWKGFQTWVTGDKSPHLRAPAEHPFLFWRETHRESFQRADLQHQTVLDGSEHVFMSCHIEKLCHWLLWSSHPG